MAKKYMVYAEGETSEDDIEIECFDTDDMEKYAAACREQGYLNVRTEVREDA